MNEGELFVLVGSWCGGVRGRRVVGGGAAPAVIVGTVDFVGGAVAVDIPTPLIVLVVSVISRRLGCLLSMPSLSVLSPLMPTTLLGVEGFRLF
jgi:hypothetical protein